MFASSTRSETSRLAALALMALPLACAPEKGETRVYRVAVGAVEEDIACYYPDEMVPPDVAADRNTLFESQTWLLFVTGDDVFLDIGSMALRGGSDFVFENIATDVTFTGVDQSEAVLTETTHSKVDFESSGRAVEGTLSETIVTRCDFLTATPSGDVCPAPPPPDCVRTASFSGVQLDADVTSDGDKDPSQVGGGGGMP